jgi:hypothetical protein
MPTMKLLLLGDDGANARDEGRLPRARDSRTNREGHDAMVIMLWARGVRCLHTWKYQSIYTVMRHALLGWAGAKGGSPPNEGRGEERRGSLFFMIYH